ncbi:hypothetical protein [Mesorhizobium mediterraneum]|uniref:hypothetical protein n=1 Tax=Mesorhizobium mediterraneum TaxID=43617 RepID=UPI00178174EB|nr:hypothetical protein [Mesorhizobium mediterraneum]
MTDQVHAIILWGIRHALWQTLSEAQKSTVWGFGPVSPRGGGSNRANCFILVDPDNEPSIPNRVPVQVGTDTWTIFLNKKRRGRYKIFGPKFPISRRDLLKSSLAAGFITASGFRSRSAAADLTWDTPPAPPGPLMGGDAIFNTKYRDANPTDVYWGTVAFVSDTAKVKEPGTASEILVNNACISSAHVHYHKDGGNIETYYHGSGITFDAKLPGWPDDWPITTPTGRWADLAWAKADTTVAVRRNEIRGLGVLQGVEAPALGDIVAKYGATTGLTVARDIGLVWRRLPDVSGQFFLVRAVSNQFSRPGDSGAAVVYAGQTPGTGASKRRKLAGFVLGGTTADDEQWYLPASPLGNPVDPDLSTVEVSLS